MQSHHMLNYYNGDCFLAHSNYAINLSDIFTMVEKIIKNCEFILLYHKKPCAPLTQEHLTHGGWIS